LVYRGQSTLARRKLNNDYQRRRAHLLALIEYQQALIDLVAFLSQLLADRLAESEFYRR
jgi:hypothetical protein